MSSCIKVILCNSSIADNIESTTEDALAELWNLVSKHVAHIDSAIRTKFIAKAQRSGKHVTALVSRYLTEGFPIREQLRLEFQVAKTADDKKKEKEQSNQKPTK